MVGLGEGRCAIFQAEYNAEWDVIATANAAERRAGAAQFELFVEVSALLAGSWCASVIFGLHAVSEL